MAVKVLDKTKLMQGRRRQMAQMEIDVMRSIQVAKKNKTDGENNCEIFAVYEDKKRVSLILNTFLGLHGHGKMWIKNPIQVL